MNMSATNSRRVLSHSLFYCYDIMRRLLLLAVIAVCLATPLSGRAQVVFLDDVTSSPISEVVLMGGGGHLIGVSDREGRVLLDSYPSDSVTASHIGYADLVTLIHPGDTLRMIQSAYSLPEVSVTALDPNADYTEMEALVRIYQYIDEIPTYYTEAVVAFFLPRRGDKLKYSIRSLRAYSDEEFIKQAKTESGSVSMGKNGLSNFLLNTPLPLGKGYTITDNGEVRRNGAPVGEVRKTEDGGYQVSIDWLGEKESRPRTLFGRTNTITIKRLVQTLSSYVPGEELSARDFLSLRTLTGLTTKYKDGPEKNLVNISDIYVLSLRSLSKGEVKAEKPSGDFGNVERSVSPESDVWSRMPSNIPPIPEVISASLGKSLRMMD